MPSSSYGARLPDHLRASLKQALIDSGKELPEDLDLDALGFDLLDTMKLLVELKIRSQKRGSTEPPLYEEDARPKIDSI